MSAAKGVLNTKLSELENKGGIRAFALVGGVTTSVSIEDIRTLEEKAIKLAGAQALVDNVAPVPEGLVVRDFLTDLDFRDTGGAANGDVAITRRDWVQPISGGASTLWLSGDVNNDRQVYTTNRSCDNDRKVYLFFGVQASNIGPADATTTLGVSSITFKRSNGTKIVDIWQLEKLDAAPLRVAVALTPVLYKRGDNARIDFRAAPKGSGTADNLILLGKVAEPVGHNVTG